MIQAYHTDDLLSGGDTVQMCRRRRVAAEADPVTPYLRPLASRTVQGTLYGKMLGTGGDRSHVNV